MNPVTPEKRPIAFWGLCVFLALSVVMLFLGQTTTLFAYDFAVKLGLQEPVSEVGQFGVEVNRAFGISDTIVYIPLIVISLTGLILRHRWALLATAAVMGISAYWAVTIASMLVFLADVPGYNLVPGLEYWISLGAYIAVGIWGLLYLALRGDKLVRAPLPARTAGTEE